MVRLHNERLRQDLDKHTETEKDLREKAAEERCGCGAERTCSCERGEGE
ncbi:hypothetical protein E2C01_100942 [Portunus trituberculatus]|uniref:Uncharacterized protein n=1 Tax=Portunus trituberculatus TaxID=210409 RepID=A0A5B7K890_PORTR|nr:hypothetical protein [Portunus trituberculatus]